MIETKYTVRLNQPDEDIEIFENPDVPGITDIKFNYHSDKTSVMFSLRDEDLPDLVRALQKRIDDAEDAKENP